MRVFISYSTSDLRVVTRLADQIKPSAEVYYWAERTLPGPDAWNSIFDWIDTADAVIVMITDTPVTRGLEVSQEVGRAIARGKRIIPIVSANIASYDLGCLRGISYQPIDFTNPQHGLDRIGEIVRLYGIDNMIRGRGF